MRVFSHCFCCLLIWSFSTQAYARGEALGLGIILGSPTGFNLNLPLAEERAFDVQVGWAPNSQHLNMTYQIWQNRAFNADGLIFDWYYGVGLHYFFRERSRAGDRRDVGMRIPFGLAHQLRDFPAIDFFGEVGPTMNFIEQTSFRLDFGVGVRFHF